MCCAGGWCVYVCGLYCMILVFACKPVCVYSIDIMWFTHNLPSLPTERESGREREREWEKSLGIRSIWWQIFNASGKHRTQKRKRKGWENWNLNTQKVEMPLILYVVNRIQRIGNVLCVHSRIRMRMTDNRELKNTFSSINFEKICGWLQSDYV